MSWPQWSSATQPPVPSVLNPAQPVINSAPAVVPPGMQYTPEQWAQLQQQNWHQWAQWQQQYQQWHQQYGAEYQKSITALAQAAQAQQLPNVAVPPPLPTEVKPPPPAEEPPPSIPAYTTAPPPQQPSRQQDYNLSKATEQRPPVHYPKSNQNWQNRDFRYGENKRQYEQGGDDPKRLMLNKPDWSNQPPPRRENTEELSEAEKKFDKQFADWEAQFNKWKEQNAEHPDKEQYREYEKKWESWRAQLLERREQMKRKRLGLSVESPNRSRPGNFQNQSFNSPQGFQQKGQNVPPKLGGPSVTPNATFSKPPPSMNDEPLKFKDQKNVPELDDVGDFFKPNTGGGIPGLDLVKDDPKTGQKENDDVVFVDPEEKEKEKKGPDFDAISKGINTILGDQKLLNMLSLVSQTQIPKQSDNLTNTISRIKDASNLESNSQLPFPEQSNQSYEEHSNHSESYGQREFVNNFDDQTRSSFTMAQNEETRFEGPGNFNRNQNHFGNRFGSFKGNRFGGPEDQFNRDRFPLGGPEEDRFRPGQDRFGPNQRFGSNQENFAPNQDRFAPNKDNFGLIQDRFGPNQNRFGPNQERFGFGQDKFGPNQERFAPNQDKFSSNQDNFGSNQERFSLNEDTFTPNQNRFGPNKERLGPASNHERFGVNQERFGGPNQNQDRFGPNQDRFGPSQEKFPPSQDRFGPNQDNQDRFPPNQDRFGPNQERFPQRPNQPEDRFPNRKGQFGFGGDNYNQRGFNKGPFEENCDDYDYDAVAAIFEVEEPPRNLEEPWNKEVNLHQQQQVPEAHIETKVAAEKQNGIFQPATVIDYDHKSSKNAEPEVLIEPIYMFDYRHKPLSRIPLPQRPKWLSETVKNIREFDPPVVRPYEPPNLRRYPPSSENWRNDHYQENRPHSRRPVFDDRRSYKDGSFDDRRSYNDRSYEDGPPFDRSYDDGKKDWNAPKWEDKKYNEERRSLQRMELEEEKISDTEWPEDEDMEPRIPEVPKFLKPEANKPTSNRNAILIEDLISPPGRYKRPPRIVIILRGPPGSGKTFLAKLIKDKEVENGGSAPRILSLDDYFMVEQEKEVTEDGKKVKVKEMVYEFEAEMEESYRSSLIKSFKKTITDGYFSFIIVDNINDKVKYFGEMWSFAKQNGFQVYICQLDLDVQTCSKRNIHGRSEADIEKCVANWEATPSHHPILDPTSLLQSASIPEVEMEEVNSPESDVREHDGSEDQVARSKWDNFDCSVDNLAKLDGVSKPLRHRTMEEYLQLDTDWTPVKPTKPGQKRVRWADLEEQKQQEKMRAIGFVVGHTNWDRMMDPTGGSSALTQTKYIERTGRYKVDQK